MTDRRLLKSNGRVAHVSLRGKVEAERFVEGEPMAVSIALTPILGAPDGRRERELITGDIFQVLEMPEDPANGYAFGFARRDGYCGFVKAGFLHEPQAVTHRVAVRETYRKETPALKTFERTFPHYFGSRLRVSGQEGDWSAVDLALGGLKSKRLFRYYFPSAHLAPISERERDPVEAAQTLNATLPHGACDGYWQGQAGLKQVAEVV